MPTFEEIQAEYATHLEQERNLSSHSIRAYLGDLESFLNHLEVQKIDDFSQTSIAHIRSWLANHGHQFDLMLVGAIEEADRNAFRRANDLTRLHEVHETACLGEAHTELALKHRRGTELG